MKLTDQELTTIGNAVREALATPTDPRGIERIVKEALDPNEITCLQCGAPPAFPKAVSVPYMCIECRMMKAA